MPAEGLAGKAAAHCHAPDLRRGSAANLYIHIFCSCSGFARLLYSAKRTAYDGQQSLQQPFKTGTFLLQHTQPKSSSDAIIAHTHRQLLPARPGLQLCGHTAPWIPPPKGPLPTHLPSPHSVIFPPLIPSLRQPLIPVGAQHRRLPPLPPPQTILAGSGSGSTGVSVSASAEPSGCSFMTAAGQYGTVQRGGAQRAQRSRTASPLHHVPPLRRPAVRPACPNSEPGRSAALCLPRPRARKQRGWPPIQHGPRKDCREQPSAPRSLAHW